MSGPSALRLLYYLGMNLFFDDSGAFSWQNGGVSLFVGLSVPDRNISATVERFEKWRRIIIGHRKRELKRQELTTSKLRSFAHAVFPRSARDTWLSVVGADTKRTSEPVIAEAHDQLSAQLLIASQRANAPDPPNAGVANTYREMADGVKNRSTSNCLWVTVEGAQHITDALDQVVVGECTRLRFAEQLRQFVAMLLRRVSLAAAQFLPDAAGIFQAPYADQEVRKVVGRGPELPAVSRFWGDGSWRDVAYSISENLFGWPEKQPNDVIAEAFRQRLQKVAGFNYVPEPVPMRNSNSAILYYLFFAAQKETAESIVIDIPNKYRKQGAL